MVDMATKFETLLSSDVCGQLWNICAWDLQSGTSTMSFKGGNSAPHTLCCLGNSHLISAQKNTPLLHLWSTAHKDPMLQKIGCVGQVSALACSPDGVYCIAAIAEKIYLWQTSSGDLIVILQRHYQTIVCLSFTDDGSHFVSGAEDNLVLVWSLASVLSKDVKSNTEPRYVCSEHSLPITDLHIGNGGCRARIFTVSRDMTCMLWELSTGSRLCTFVFDDMISAVAVNSAECHLFVGTNTGRIHKVNLYEKPLNHVQHKSSGCTDFKGHMREVSCLCCSQDGSMLVSGSLDASVKLWDVVSLQCIRTILHKGAITNILLVAPLTPCKDMKQLLPILSFKHSLHSYVDIEQEPAAQVVTVPTGKCMTGCKVSAERLRGTTLRRLIKQVDGKKGFIEATDDEEDKIAKVRRLQQINKKLYNFTVSKVLSPR